MDVLDKLIEVLCAERGESVPKLTDEQKPDYFRALCNVRPPLPVSAEFLALQDEYLTAAKARKAIVDAENFAYVSEICLHKGDITALKCDAIVNAANSAMLGCFHPLHNCIDNAIHSAAGVQMRLSCSDLMKGKQAQNGEVIITKGYNLPCKFVFHTVGPIVQERVTEQNKADLRSCYVNCLRKADEMQLRTIAFCCISTGVFGYPKIAAAQLAVQTVKECKNRTHSQLKVIFDVFSEQDYAIYKQILG